MRFARIASLVRLPMATVMSKAPQSSVPSVTSARLQREREDTRAICGRRADRGGRRGGIPCSGKCIPCSREKIPCSVQNRELVRSVLELQRKWTPESDGKRRNGRKFRKFPVL